MVNLNEIADKLSALSILDAVKLAEILEEKWGVSAKAQVAAAVQVAPVAAAEKTEFDVILAAIGDKKIEVIKEVRAITSLQLKEAKDLVEAAPSSLKQGVTKAEAEAIKAKFEAVGAKIEIK